MSGTTLQRRVYDMLETRHPRGLAFVVQGGLLILILANVAAVVLETVTPIEARYGAYFHAFEIFSVSIFAVEYALRLWCCTQSPHERFRHPLHGRLRYARTPMAAVDLIAVLPGVALLFGADLGALRIVRILRIFKLLRYSAATAMLGRVLYNERKGLFGGVIVFLVLLLLASTVAYFAEREAQPKAFGSIPDAMWWAMAALTTVGYGDVTPITTLGRVIGGFVTLLGIGVIALPTAILAGGFVEESKRRDFVVTWQLLADVPLFQHWTAPRIAELVPLLRPRFVQDDEVIVRKGDIGNSMYIIADGEAEVDLGPDRAPVMLAAGQFFGELALIHKAPRNATVRAAGDCKLLELSARDFEDLLVAHPDLHKQIHAVAAGRRDAPGA